MFLDQLTAQFQNSDYWTDDLNDSNEFQILMLIIFKLKNDHYVVLKRSTGERGWKRSLVRSEVLFHYFLEKVRTNLGWLEPRASRIQFQKKSLSLDGVNLIKLLWPPFFSWGAFFRVRFHSILLQRKSYQVTVTHNWGYSVRLS